MFVHKGEKRGERGQAPPPPHKGNGKREGEKEKKGKMEKREKGKKRSPNSEVCYLQPKTLNPQTWQLENKSVF